MKETLERLGASASYEKLAWMSEEWRQSSKLLKPRSFDAYKNAAALMIAILDCLEIDIEFSDVGIKIMESDDCREVLRSNRDANSMLAIMQEGARFSCKDGQNFIHLFVQSISGLCWVS